jgi:hypothetical protein
MGKEAGFFRENHQKFIKNGFFCDFVR